MEVKLKISIFSIIAVIVVAIVVIVGIVVNSNKTIELTNENYSDYLDVRPSIQGDSEYKVYMGTYQNMPYYDAGYNNYNKIQLSVNVKGLSDNFIYEDIEVNVHFSGECSLLEVEKKGVYNSVYTVFNKNLKPTVLYPAEFEKTGEQKIDKTIAVKCDVSGNVKSNEEKSITVELPKDTYVSKDDIENIIKNIEVKGTVRLNK